MKLTNEFRNNTEPKKLSEVKKQEAFGNFFRNGAEPKKINIVGGRTTNFKPTDPKLMTDLIGRDASPKRILNKPYFEEDLKTAHTPHIAFMFSMVKTSFKLFRI